MGSGRANLDLPLIMKILALVFCAVAVGLNVAELSGSRSNRSQLVSNSVIYSSGAYLIILLYFFIWSIAKAEVDQKLTAIVLICGFLWTVGAGIGVILFKSDYSAMLSTNQLVGGILVLAAGCVMLADGLHNLGCF
ncbi:uncharacterized protein LOC109538571 [Dendroctonus ponderosae]|uniref:MARVEL domain-containing protein n=1 Tax=Dendroctonus ponderosae TaxID=77166 RepID=A0AAR5PKH2_DENPD|nr:uncharacterized protein LOC109538571 [Dendroctonus ponderosae]KAH1024653.1 hypothetical protein HUJ05_004107 [Dendroctonus ponderosae]